MAELHITGSTVCELHLFPSRCSIDFMCLIIQVADVLGSSAVFFYVVLRSVVSMHTCKSLVCFLTVVLAHSVGSSTVFISSSCRVLASVCLILVLELSFTT